jgi:hypothetical protein
MLITEIGAGLPEAESYAGVPAMMSAARRRRTLLLRSLMCVNR